MFQRNVSFQRAVVFGPVRTKRTLEIRLFTALDFLVTIERNFVFVRFVTCVTTEHGRPLFVFPIMQVFVQN